MSPDTGSLTYRVGKVEDRTAELEGRVDEHDKTLTKLEPLPRAAAWTVGVIVAGAIGFAFSVLVLIPQ